MEIPDPVSVGYFPKVTERRPDDWPGPKTVIEMCSVSECISSGPENWIDKWLHNELGFFPTERKALKVADDPKQNYSMYAYKLYPLKFDDGQARPWEVPVSEVLDLTEFEFLGFDPVSRSQDSYPECSPLSCNTGASDFRVNRYCLLEGLDYAYRACVEISGANYEPGPYYLFEVYRRRQGV
jgi:hypothetical protein